MDRLSLESRTYLSLSGRGFSGRTGVTRGHSRQYFLPGRNFLPLGMELSGIHAQKATLRAPGLWAGLISWQGAILGPCVLTSTVKV